MTPSRPIRRRRLYANSPVYLLTSRFAVLRVAMGPTLLRLICILMLTAVVGCATERTITISTRPADAFISIDGVDRGRAPVTQTFVFTNDEQSYNVVAKREGYKDATWRVTREFTGQEQVIELQPLTRTVTFNVAPVPAILSINGKPVSADPVSSYTAQDLPFTKDARDEWTRYHVTAEREGYRTAEAVITWTDREFRGDGRPTYTLVLQPMRKDIRVTTEPTGAEVYLDNQRVGVAPVQLPDTPFKIDPDTNEYIPRTLRVTKAGYPPIELPISWDAGQSEYHIELKPLSKVVQLRTDPPHANITIDGIKDFSASTDDEGLVPIEMLFPPINDEGELRTYTVRATRTTEDREWYPGEIEIGWDGGRTEYELKLREVLTTTVPLLTIDIRREPHDWTVEINRIETVAMKDTAEESGRRVERIYTARPGEFIDTIAISPDGQRLVFTTLPADAAMPLRSQLRAIQANGSGGEQQLTDGQSLDFHPSFTPDGRRIVFSSNRMSRKVTVCSINTDGTGGITEITRGDSFDLWPSVDSDPRARLYYARHMENRDQPRLYVQQIEAGFRTDRTDKSGTQPRPSPQADAVVFVSPNDKTGKMDVFRLTEFGIPENLTNTPDFDETNPIFNRHGTRIAFVSDRAEHPETGHNRDIWILDLDQRDKAVQVTTNGSWDDSPVWDPISNAIYFRSNRGGTWGIWKIWLD